MGLLKSIFFKLSYTLFFIIINFFNEYIEIPNKFWLHRTNSIGKVEELSYKYSGIEIDVNYNLEKNYYDVTHDIPKSISLNLKNVLSSLKGNKQKKIWIDYKNLNKENVDLSILEMNSILENLDLDKNQLVIESGNYILLKNFKENGYYTSYYVPYLNLNKMNDIEKEAEKKRLLKIKNTGNINAFSFPGYLYLFIKEINVGNLDLLTWESGHFWTDFYLNKNLYKMLKDNKIKAILTKEFGNHSR